MSMFDYLRCEPNLPDGWCPPEDHLFQTNDLDRELATHCITHDGRLMVARIIGYENVPKNEWKYHGAEPGSLHELLHEKTKKRAIWQEIQMPWHGYIDFVGREGLKPFPGGPMTGAEMKEYTRWHRYRAKFTDGRLVEIIVVNED